MEVFWCGMGQGLGWFGGGRVCLINRDKTSYVFIYFNFFLPSSGIASCVGTAGTMMWCLHLTRPCCVVLGQVLIWVVSPDWLRSFVNWVFLIIQVLFTKEVDSNLIFSKLGKLKELPIPTESKNYLTLVLKFKFEKLFLLSPKSKLLVLKSSGEMSLKVPIPIFNATK